MRRAMVAFILAACLSLLTSGCSTFFGGIFKDAYWDEIHGKSDEDEAARKKNDAASSFFVGIRTQAHEAPFQTGIPVEWAYAESPADHAGLRRFDEIRSIDGVAVRTPGEARRILTRLWKEAPKPKLDPDEVDPSRIPTPWVTTPIVYVRDGRQIETSITLWTREAYLDLRRRRVLEQSFYDEWGKNGWFLKKTRTISPEFVDGYFGVKLPRVENGDDPGKPEPLLIASDVDILPLVFGFSLLRIERVQVAFATRVTFLLSLLQFSTRGNDVARTLEGLIPKPPEEFTDL